MNKLFFLAVESLDLDLVALQNDLINFCVKIFVRKTNEVDMNKVYSDSLFCKPLSLPLS